MAQVPAKLRGLFVCWQMQEMKSHLFEELIYLSESEQSDLEQQRHSQFPRVILQDTAKNL